MTSSITFVSQAWNPPGQTVRVRRRNGWISMLGLVLADALSFLFVSALFRAGHSTTALVVFLGRNTSASSTPISVFLLLACVFIVARYFSGDYSRRQLFWDGAKTTTQALLLVSLPDIGMLLLGGGIYEVDPVLFSWLSLLFLVPVMRQGARQLMSWLGFWKIPTAMIGVGPRSEEIYRKLSSTLPLGFGVRWLVIEDTHTSPPPGLSQLRSIHSPDPERTAALICAEGCRQAVVATEDMQIAYFAETVQRLVEAGVPVTIIPSINRLPLANATTNYFFGSDIFLMQVSSRVQRLPSRFLKRLFDVCIALLLLVCVSPFFLVLALIIRRTSPGRAVYFHTRIGKNSKPFRCLKFRTMVQDAEAVLQRWGQENPHLWAQYHAAYKLRDDPRITPIGRWLRMTCLDELPQLWNVLRGDMSLVGPRPVTARELDEHYGPAAQLYAQVRPGITGLWQVTRRNDTTYRRRIFLDEWYILNWSFWYDIVILIRTLWIVINRKGEP